MLEKAIEEARKTMRENKGGPFGALVIDMDNNIISVASNTVLGSHDPSAHAEINAIRKASSILKTHDLSNCKLYTTAYPCPMCMSAIIWANIKEVFYGADVASTSKIGFRDDYIYNFIKDGCKDDNILLLKQIEKDKCIDLFKEYVDKDKEIY